MTPLHEPVTPLHEPVTPLRVGLIGTSPWAERTHAAALMAADGVDFAGVWGRDPAKAGALAAATGVTAYTDVDALLADCEAVVLSVPPDVQASLATRAARAGKHLLLEKPLALSVEAAEALVDAVREAGISSRVFFTWRYTPEGRTWLADVAGGGWEGGSAQWLGGVAGGPHDTAWRRERGALWDLGPHVLSMLSAALGPVEHVTAVAGARDLVHLTLRHDSGVTSTATLTITAPAAAHRVALELWGPTGWTAFDRSTAPAALAARTAVEELAVAARSQPGAPDPCDVEHGAYVVGLIAAAQAQLSARAANRIR